MVDGRAIRANSLVRMRYPSTVAPARLLAPVQCQGALEGAQHPDRDAQFHYINEQVRRHLRRGEPVVSVDAKRKVHIGNYRNAGKEWRRAKAASSSDSGHWFRLKADTVLAESGQARG